MTADYAPCGYLDSLALAFNQLQPSRRLFPCPLLLLISNYLSLRSSRINFYILFSSLISLIVLLVLLFRGFISLSLWQLDRL